MLPIGRRQTRVSFGTCQIKIHSIERACERSGSRDMAARRHYRAHAAVGRLDWVRPGNPERV